MTLNGLMAIILCYFSKLGRVGRALRKVVDDIQVFMPPKSTKLDLTTDVVYVANLVKMSIRGCKRATLQCIIAAMRSRCGQ